MHIAFFGFIVALFGVLTGFVGVALQVSTISLLGYCACVVGVAVGFVGIVLGWFDVGKSLLRDAPDAIKQFKRGDESRRE